MLGVTEEALVKVLTHREVRAGKDIVVTTLNYTQAINSRDGIAKAVYSALFDWMAEQVNIGVERVRTGPGENSIGVLDIFGFEIFEVNSFEQLCINLTNEKLQYHFNDHVFNLELEVYRKERLDVQQIQFKDNQGCLDLIEVCAHAYAHMPAPAAIRPRARARTAAERAALPASPCATGGCLYVEARLCALLLRYGTRPRAQTLVGLCRRRQSVSVSWQ